MSLHLARTVVPFGPAAALELTDAEVDALGGGKRAAVLVTIGGRSARLRLAVMDGRNVIGLSKAARTQLGVEMDSDVEVDIALDTAERVVELPADLAAALAAEPGLRDAFDALAYSHRKEHVRSVSEAKRDETRQRRIDAVVAAVRA